MSRRIIWILFFLYLIILIKLILFKNRIGSIVYYDYFRRISFHENLSRVNIVPLKSIFATITEEGSTFVIQNIGGNIILFIPLGIFLPLLFSSLSSFYSLITIAFDVSVTFEVVQLIGRLGVCDIDDIILNTLGAAIGFFLYKKFILPKVRNFNTNNKARFNSNIETTGK